MYSMTGFGRAELANRLGKLTVEMTGVNNRFLEIHVRLPKQYFFLEGQIREFLSGRLSRGKINVNIGLEEPENAAGKVLINGALVEAYVKQFRKLEKDLKITSSFNLGDLLVLPEVVRPARDDVSHEVVWKTVKRGLRAAADQLLAMRSREGRAMEADMRKRLKAMSALIRQVERKTANSTKVYAAKLKERIEELLDGPVGDAQKLEQEIAFFADRTDISEECVRFRSHLDEYRSAFKSKNAIGRRLNFVLQEMNREVNTIGSKCADFGISSVVISLKEEVEKLRELVQNVE